ncbi:MAG: hypothetical protein NC924_04035 [Candidatus Omnitrophica bacterium]|nr:hypothetical protein [Candidatus Omnitrophota bacterium]
MIETVGFIASVVLPLWNIPLIIRIVRLRSSRELSLWWVFGVWTCLILMLPVGIVPSDTVFKVFCVVNFALFSAVVVTVVMFRQPALPQSKQANPRGA